MSSTAIDKTRSRKSAVLLWLRKTHGWIGLWGAILGLLFGVTGFLLNHRGVMKIPATQTHESTIQLQLPNPIPENPQDMTLWLQKELAIDREPGRTRREKSKPVSWGDKTVIQPEHWMMGFNSPNVSFQTDYWVGNNFVTVKRNENNLLGTLNNFHKGNGVSIPWILFIDSIAGSMIFLSITGVLLWTQLNKRRLVGSAILASSFILMAIFGAQSL